MTAIGYQESSLKEVEFEHKDDSPAPRSMLSLGGFRLDTITRSSVWVSGQMCEATARHEARKGNQGIAFEEKMTLKGRHIIDPSCGPDRRAPLQVGGAASSRTPGKENTKTRRWWVVLGKLLGHQEVAQACVFKCYRLCREGGERQERPI